MTTEPRTPAKGQMLPGIAGICMYMLVVAIVGVFGTLRGAFPAMVVLPICTMIVVGAFGLLRLRRWGWRSSQQAVSCCPRCMAGWQEHGAPRFWVMAALDFCLFLYLVRQETRARLL